MSSERLWERLFQFLDGWSTAAEVEPGRIEVTVEHPDGSTRVVEILMTPDEWDDMVTVPWGDFDSAAREVRKTVLGLRDHERFLVYAQYELSHQRPRTRQLTRRTYASTNWLDSIRKGSVAG